MRRRPEKAGLRTGRGRRLVCVTTGAGMLLHDGGRSQEQRRVARRGQEPGATACCTTEAGARSNGVLHDGGRRLLCHDGGRSKYLRLWQPRLEQL